MRRSKSPATSHRRWPICLSRIGAIIALGVYSLGCARTVDVEPPHEIMVNETALSVKEPVLPAKAADPSSKGAELFAPTGWKPAGARESQALKEGRSLFESAGCATCHRARLGEVDGPYSDLLLHDLGQALSDSGSYYGISEPDSPSPA